MTLGRTVAAFLLLARPQDNPEFVDRVRLGWAREMAMIDHPGVVQVFDTGVDPVAGLYVITQYVQGETLKQVLDRQGRLTAINTMDFIAQVADALSALHGCGLVHRGLTPTRVMVLPDATIALSVFGLERRAQGLDLLLGLGQAAANFVAPEHAQGDPATYQSDLFSLGVIAYQCLSGRRPFEGDSPLDVAVQVVRDALPPLPADVSTDVSSIVERAMAKDLAAPWPTAAALAAAARSAGTAR
jgi:serine/threonine protein kinase